MSEEQKTMSDEEIKDGFGNDPLEGMNEASGGNKWAPEVGEVIKGTYLERRDIPAKRPYPPQIAYVLDTKDGEIICYFGLSKKFVHNAMKRAQFGQIVAFKREDDFLTEAHKNDPKNVAPAKSFKVFLGNLDPNYNPDGLKEIDANAVPFD